MNKVITLIGAGILAASVLGSCGSSGSNDSSGDSSAGTIKIGFSGDFSGLLAGYDVPVRDGAKFAAEQINSEGGPWKVDLSTSDNKGDPKITVTQTQGFLDEGRLIEIIGTGDGRTAAASLVGESNGLSLATLNTYPTFTTEAGPNSATLAVTDNIQAAASAEFACDKGYRSVYTFASNDFAYSKNLPVYFKEAFAKHCGGRVSGTGEFSLGQTDYSALVTKLKNQAPQPDAIYSPMFVPDSVAFVKQLRQAGVELPYLSSDANYLKAFADGAGSAGDGLVNSAFAFAEKGTPLGTFAREYAKATGEQASTPLYEAMGRDQIYGIVKAAELAGSADPKKIIAMLPELPADTFVAMNNAKISAKTRSPISATISMVEVNNGGFKLLTEITPSFIPAPTR